LSVKHAPKPFEDREVDETLEQLREQHAEFRTVERAADPGDLVLMDYTLTPEGMEPRSEKGYGFVIGSGGVMPEIEEAVIGLNAGGERTVNVRFPDAHQTESLRGKSGVAKVKVNEVKEKILPPLDDELAKTVGQVDTLDALKAEVRKGLQTRRESENRRALEEAVTDAVLASHPIEVPEALVLRQVGHLIEHTKERMRRQGMDPEKLPWDYGKLLQELRPGAEKAVRRALILEAIAEKEGLNPSEADIEAEIANLVIAQMLFLEAEDPDKDISLYINSPGGSVTAGMAIYDTMQYVKADVSTICMGQAASMGALLLAAGARGKRFALPHARI